MLKSGLILALGLLSAAAPAAGQETRVVSRTVSYADLDLSSPAGVHRFDRRVRAVIAEMCGDAHQFDLTAQIERRHCRSRAWQDFSATRSTLLATRTRGSGQVVVATR